MLFVIIGLLVGAIIVTKMLYEECRTIIGKALCILFGVPLGAAMGAFMGIVAAGVVGGALYLADIKQETVFVSEKPIYSVVDNIGMEGHFVLGSGSIKDQLKYYFVIKEDSGSKIESVSAEDTHIASTEDNPAIKTYHTDFKHKAWWAIGLNFKEGKSYVLMVPPDTVKKQYNIDLK